MEGFTINVVDVFAREEYLKVLSQGK